LIIIEFIFTANIIFFFSFHLLIWFWLSSLLWPIRDYLGSYTRVSKILSQAPMTALIAPGCDLGAKHNTANALGQVHLAFLEVGALFHELIRIDNFDDLGEH